MDTAALDAFFAQAEDVLTDWNGGTDAMHGRPPVDEEALAPAGDSYYDQGWMAPDVAMAAILAHEAVFCETYIGVTFDDTNLGGLLPPIRWEQPPTDLRLILDMVRRDIHHLAEVTGTQDPEAWPCLSEPSPGCRTPESPLRPDSDH